MCNMVSKAVTCFAERVMVLTFLQNLMQVDTRVLGRVLLFSWWFHPGQNCFKGRLPVALGEYVEALDLCFLHFSLFKKR